MLTNEPHECFRIGVPVFREALEIFEDSSEAGSHKESHGVLGVFVKIGVENTLIHEVRLAFDWKQQPPEVVQFECGKVVRGGSHRRLDFPGVLVKRRLTAGNDFRNDAESVASGSLRKDWTVLAL